jgi:DEAD/DEAH box helicase domain-containing protein
MAVMPKGTPDTVAQGDAITTYLDFLKRYVLSNAVVHHEIIPARPAQCVTDLGHFPPVVADILRTTGIPALYTHQAAGIAKALAGQNVAIATPTASGKTLVYNIPVITTLLENRRAHALYIFPLKALEQDQYDELRTLLTRLGTGLSVDIYDGDTPAQRRKQLRASPPHVLITTGYAARGLLAFHEAWATFFSHLQYIVIDELHTYSGVFGTHVLHLLRRLNRICALYGSQPRYITSSATIGNPADLASTLVNRPFHAVLDNGAPAAPRHFVFLNPVESPNTMAANLLRLSVLRQYRTIVFTRARVITELIYRWATHERPELRQVISSYRAGYLPEERRQIETALNAGELLGVISTSALELGIDIGGLDVCILVGYPGSIVSTWQRAGRVGRAVPRSWCCSSPVRMRWISSLCSIHSISLGGRWRTRSLIRPMRTSSRVIWPVRRVKPRSFWPSLSTACRAGVRLLTPWYRKVCSCRVPPAMPGMRRAKSPSVWSTCGRLVSRGLSTINARRSSLAR